MTKFESKDVENYYYDTLKKLGIRHILWDSGRTITQNDVDLLASESSGYTDSEISRIPFVDAP
jgi:hypothetical protein